MNFNYYNIEKWDKYKKKSTNFQLVTIEQQFYLVIVIISSKISMKIRYVFHKVYLSLLS